MKFENPIMNISMFELENVVTTSGGGGTPGTELQTAAAKAQTALENKSVAANNILSFSFD